MLIAQCVCHFRVDTGRLVLVTRTNWQVQVRFLVLTCPSNNTTCTQRAATCIFCRILVFSDSISFCQFLVAYHSCQHEFTTKSFCKLTHLTPPPITIIDDRWSPSINHVHCFSQAAVPAWGSGQILLIAWLIHLGNQFWWNVPDFVTLNICGNFFNPS